MDSKTPENKTVSFKSNPYFIGSIIIWLIATIYIQFFADLPLLRYGDQQPIINRLLQVSVLAISAVILFLARRAGIKPIDHTSNLGISYKNAQLETIWLLAYMFVTMGIGYALNIHSHVHISAFADGTQTILGLEPLSSSLVWATYNFIIYTVIPLVYFMGIRNYNARSLLLKFPNARTFMPIAIIVGLIGVVPLMKGEFFVAPIMAHVLTFLIYTLGAVLPVAIFTQALLAPRLAILSKSWITGTVLAALAYTAFNLNEYFLEWDSLEKVSLSLITLVAGDFGWGLLKAIVTLSLNNAWMHVFTTHTFHYGDSAVVAEVFNLK